ncbi:hypothetical protein HDU98_000043 [Podochytrium sp. JEL0797]|nr:hypothetical protein HDU98_000043 [Podochytrium sp. JEL0797]
MSHSLKNNADLRAAFEEFALFGTPRFPISPTSPPPPPLGLDNAKFAKLCRDSGLVDHASLSPIDVDIIFAKCKQKGKRKLMYIEFLEALREVAKTRQCEVDHVVALVVTAVPEINGTIPEVDDLLDKLTDTSLYTGTHKNRFDPVTGHGLGLEGRETVNPTSNLSTIVSRHNSAKTLGSRVTPTRGMSLPTPRSLSPVSSLGGGAGSPSVFERLNHVSSFTGTHRHRFNEDGTGRGKAGRE